MRRPFPTILGLFFLLAGAAQPQEPQITALNAAFQNETIRAHVQLKNLFVPKIVSTIRSGLPAIVEHDFRLFTAAGREKAQAQQTVEVKYDLWAQRFRLAFPDTVRFTATFEEVEKAFEGFAMSPFPDFPLSEEAAAYQLRLRVAVIPISAEQSKQLLQRLAANDFESENAATAAGRSGFSLNLSSLISFFFSGEERARGVSAWAVSPPFQRARQP